jgi:hypothetical protein
VYQATDIQSTIVSLNLNTMTVALNPGDRVTFYLEMTNSGGVGAATAISKYATYAPVSW